uniref:Uncharacterized protein n=2 Tax=Rhizobium/Agrobacterium group TaxID=227290 RepID=A0A2Z2PLF3_AGRTU|nr:MULTISPECIES: hypothetical protein [Rhizobium/Agrobacterium group]ASK43677.1 hypothetical protein [Agrobacterium radiobacter]ASK43807.1 hypothetical protein [Rhizobium rhizogenes]
MSAPVSHSTEQALRAAMNRLLTGSAIKSDGRLTVVNLAIEAGVSRATANRAAAVLIEFRRAIGERREQPNEIAGLREAEKRSNTHILAQHAQARALYQRQAQQRAVRAQILSFRRRSDDDNNENQ